MMGLNIISWEWKCFSIRKTQVSHCESELLGNNCFQEEIYNIRTEKLKLKSKKENKDHNET